VKVPIQHNLVKVVFMQTRVCVGKYTGSFGWALVGLAQIPVFAVGVALQTFVIYVRRATATGESFWKNLTRILF